jgi:hypothetical protein
VRRTLLPERDYISERRFAKAIAPFRERRTTDSTLPAALRTQPAAPARLESDRLTLEAATLRLAPFEDIHKSVI